MEQTSGCLPGVQQPYLIQQYATPVRNQYRLLAGLEP